MCVGDSVWLGWCGIRIASACNTDTTPTQPPRFSNTHRTTNKMTYVVIQQNSRKLLMMDILMSETCWAHKKWNKIASDIKLVFFLQTARLLISAEICSPLLLWHSFMRLICCFGNCFVTRVDHLLESLITSRFWNYSHIKYTKTFTMRLNSLYLLRQCKLQSELGAPIIYIAGSTHRFSFPRPCVWMELSTSKMHIFRNSLALSR